ncbi:catenin alpha-3 [Trichomycterus rosablanca]|uniref:catenin alpha-3 n=1 Tax=Trichomycterus rosablanca TaxID=2290929 RepID=UPI002F3546D9
MAFLTEDNLMRTISLERVVAPIATHLFYLLLLSESEADTEQFTQLEVSGCAVAKASRNMANVASRVISESDDDIMRIEMSPLLESLIISGQQVLLETQKLSIQPEVTEHRGELVKATQNVLLGVLKILLVEDDATIRKITAAAHWLLASLSEVGVATNLKSLLKAFQLYSKAMLLLHNLVMERIEEVCDYRCQSVKASVGNLRSCISMLHTAVYLTIKHPTSEEALGAKKYIFHLVNSTVNDIIITLKSNCKSMHRGKYGHYTGKWKMLLKLLSDREFSSFIDSNFDIVLLDLVVYSKAVANCSRKEIQSCLTANCRRVLHLWLQISQQIKGCKDKQKSKVFQDNTYVSLIQQIHKLDEAVVKATIYLVMDTFVLTSNPIEQFVNTTYSLPENDPYGAFHLDPIQPLSKSLIVYTDRIFEVASFVSALAFDEISVENVENSMSCLNYLKDSIIVLLQELREDSVQYHRTSHKLNHFYYKWVEETKQLQNAFCEVINVKNIIHPFVQEMNNDLDSCVEAHKDQDFNLLRKYMRFLTVRMNQVICFVRRHLDKSDDPIYRNGLLILVRQAEHSVAKVTGYATDTFNTNFHGNAFSLLTDSAREAIKVFDILYKGLDGLQHPHLLSPLREAVWQPATTRPVLLITEPQKPTDNQELSVQLYNGNKKEELVKCNDKENKKENVKHITSYHFENNKLVIPSVMDSTSAEITQDLDLLPLLCELVHITKAKDVEALNTACTGIVELSSCYTQATEEATCIVEGTANQEIKILRSKLVALTPLLVQTAQETAMSSARSTETVYRHSTQFSDLIKKTKKILLPVVGMWYFAVQAMIHGCSPNITDSCIQELTEVMCLCTDTVQLVMTCSTN